VIQFDTALITIGNPKVIYPAKYILTDFKELVMYRHARFFLSVVAWADPFLGKFALPVLQQLLTGR
jgi:hypothetical protein